MHERYTHSISFHLYCGSLSHSLRRLLKTNYRPQQMTTTEICVNMRLYIRSILTLILLFPFVIVAFRLTRSLLLYRQVSHSIFIARNFSLVDGCYAMQCACNHVVFFFIQIFIDDMKCKMWRDTKVICSNCTLSYAFTEQQGV